MDPQGENSQSSHLVVQVNTPHTLHTYAWPRGEVGTELQSPYHWLSHVVSAQSGCCVLICAKMPNSHSAVLGPARTSCQAEPFVCVSSQLHVQWQSCWELEISHDVNVYTKETSKLYKEKLSPTREPVVEDLLAYHCIWASRDPENLCPVLCRFEMKSRKHNLKPHPSFLSACTNCF